MNTFSAIMLALLIIASVVFTVLVREARKAGRDKSLDTKKCPVCGKVFPVQSDDETTTIGYHLRVGSPCGEKFLHDWMMGWVPNKDAELKTKRSIEQARLQVLKDYMRTRTERFYNYFKGDEWDKERRKEND